MDDSYQSTRKFDGRIKDFKIFRKDVLCTLRAKNRAASLFLSPIPPYIKNADGAWQHVDRKYLPLPLPDPDEPGISQAERQLRGDQYDRAIRHNETQENIFNTLRTVIYDRLAPNLLPQFSELIHDMEIYEYWLALPTMYGPETMGHIAFGDLIFDTLYTTMKDTYLFASTISQLEIDWTEAHFSDEMKSAILFSDGSNKFKYQFLPQRFNSALQYVRTNNLSYDAAKNYLRVQDQLLPRAPQVIAPSTQVNAVQQQKKDPANLRLLLPTLHPTTLRILWLYTTLLPLNLYTSQFNVSYVITLQMGINKSCVNTATKNITLKQTCLKINGLKIVRSIQ